MSDQSIIKTMPAEQYHAADGLSFSMLKILSAQSPMHLKCYMDGEKLEPTEAMTFGSLTHTFILEPDAFKYSLRPDGMDYRSKAGKEWRDSQKDPILTGDELKSLKGMAKAVHAHPIAKRLLSGGKSEQSLFARDSKGTMRKCRVDYLPTSGNVIVDLKTCGDASPLEFGKNVANLSYLGQAYYYLKLCKMCGLDKSAFAFIAVEKTPPYAVAVYQPPDEWIEAAGRIVEADVQRFRNCVESNNWPAYGNEILPMQLPQWAEKQLQQIQAA